MNHFQRMLSAVLTLGGVWCQAEEIAFDNRFAENGKGGISGWLYNKTEYRKPFAEITPVMVDGQSGISITANGKRVQLYTSEQIPAKYGDTFTFTARVSGKGRYAFGLYQYGEKVQWQWLGLSAVWRRAAEGKVGTIKVPVPPNKPEVKNVCLVLIVDSDASITFSNLHCEK